MINAIARFAVLLSTGETFLIPAFNAMPLSLRTLCVAFTLLLPAFAVANEEAAAKPENTSPQPVVLPEAGHAQRTEQLADRRRSKIADAVREANRQRDIYTSELEGPAASQARRREAIALIDAVQLGDASQETRLASLVEIVRGDVELSEIERSEVVARRSYQQVNLGSLKTDEERFAAIERIERGLTVEFPSAPNGYEALYRLALYCDDIKGKALAEEVVGMGGAPDSVKIEARKLLGRYALIGRNLQELLPEGTPLVPSGETEIVIYAWSSAQRGSIAFAKLLQEKVPPGTQLIGVCLDQDEASGRATAQAQGLDGENVFDVGGELATQLRFDWAPLAYIAGGDGRIRTVCGVRELSRRLSSARQAGSQSEGGK